ncbi:MAG TPA: YgiQ family radical SAM protein [Candidatus Thermoplasmatota archaeon]|nr:YgiQ family radical SAM protein [Candidatus Thermoplasmatota archaeon]
MIAKTGRDFDIILITGEYYDDHPLSPVGIIARVLDAKGYRVGIIEKPLTKEHFTRLGSPRLCFGVTSGSIDSMLHNYTPMKRKRIEDRHSTVQVIPDRAVIVYCNKIKEYFKPSTIVIGGIEASLRRFAHYDYWENAVRRSILLDSRADILVYGNGEKQILEIGRRLDKGHELDGIEGTCVLRKDLGPSFEPLPSYTEVMQDKKKFCEMQMMFSNAKDLAQEYTNNYVLQYRYPRYTTADLDWVYSLPFSRKLHPKSLLKMGKFTVVTHRGCFGACNFCSLSLHQGDRIIERSEENILAEIRRLTTHPEFKGYIDDLMGPSSNMYGMQCTQTTRGNLQCQAKCIGCSKLDTSHQHLIALLRKARQIKGVKKIFIRSGIRYDLALESKEYIKEISEHHISGCLKIAPEHFSKNVVALMGKDNTRFDEFLSYFTELNVKKRQALRYYFMIGHPGDSMDEVLFLRDVIRKKRLTNLEQFQVFTPTPMTVSSCMYWTGLNPFTGKKIDVIYDYNTKKKLKRILLDLEELHSEKRR